MPLFALPPTIADDAKYSQGGKGQHNDASVKCLGRSFAQLLGRSGANGALRPARCDAGHHDNKQEYEE